MLWQLINNLIGHNYLISCILLLVLSVILFFFHYDFSDSTSSFTAAVSGFIHPIIQLISVTTSIKEFTTLTYANLTDELFLFGAILEIILLLISFLTMPCLRWNELKSPLSRLINILIVLAYYSFGMIIGIGVRKICLIGAVEGTGRFIQVIIVLIGAFAIFLATATQTDREERGPAKRKTKQSLNGTYIMDSIYELSNDTLYNTSDSPFEGSKLDLKTDHYDVVLNGAEDPIHFNGTCSVMEDGETIVFYLNHKEFGSGKLVQDDESTFIFCDFPGFDNQLLGFKKR